MNIYHASGRFVFYLLYPVFMVRPSTRTRGLIFDENNRILLVKNWVSNTPWDMPGGGLHRNESLEACLSREVLEETGIKVEETAWQPVATRRRYATNFVYFTATITAVEPKFQKWELTDAGWFNLEELPPKREPLVDDILSTYMHSRLA